MAMQDGELETWQEIAAYLGVSVREAQYREKNDQMPVHRLPGRKSRVWAYRLELDEWKARHGSAPANGSVGKKFLTRRGLLLGGLAGGVLAAGGAALLLKRHGRPERAILTGNLLTAQDGLGRTLWTHRFSGTLQQFSDVEMRWRVQVVDFKGDGYPSVVVACRFLAESSADVSALDELWCFAPDGTKQWALPCQPPLLDCNGRPFEPGWLYSHVVASPAGNGQVLFVSSRHQTWFPGCVQRVDAHGQSRLQFANTGFIECLCRVPKAGGDWIAISGENNAFDRAFVAVIGVDDQPSCSPAGGPPRYRFVNGPTGASRAYILFPTVEPHKGEQRCLR